MEEKERKHYESHMKEIQKEVGSVQNARYAIYYRDSLPRAIEWKRESTPELAAGGIADCKLTAGI